MLHHGYLRAGRLFGVDLRIHWSVPVGAVLFTRARFEPLLWLAFAIIIIVHELGHAVAVKRCGYAVLGIDLTGLGGQCRWRGRANDLERAVIAWGGIVAQALLLLATVLATAVGGAPRGRAGLLLSQAFVDVNLWIMALNLLPLPPLDGVDAWRLFGELERAGWTPSRAILGPLRRWARQRRDARLSDRPEPLGESDGPEPKSEPSTHDSVRVSSPPAEDAPSANGHRDSDAPQPSAQAQRELAALLERIGDEAGKAKRRR